MARVASSTVGGKPEIWLPSHMIHKSFEGAHMGVSSAGGKQCSLSTSHSWLARNWKVDWIFGSLNILMLSKLSARAHFKLCLQWLSIFSTLATKSVFGNHTFPPTSHKKTCSTKSARCQWKVKAVRYWQQSMPGVTCCSHILCTCKYAVPTKHKDVFLSLPPSRTHWIPFTVVELNVISDSWGCGLSLSAVLEAHVLCGCSRGTMCSGTKLQRVPLLEIPHAGWIVYKWYIVLQDRKRISRHWVFCHGLSKSAPSHTEELKIAQQQLSGTFHPLSSKIPSLSWRGDC